jgi:membrane protease YdiL (CAAX protease family)
MTTTLNKHIVIKYFILVIILSIPFYVLGAFVNLTKYIPIQLPISALIFLCPMLAAIILTGKYGKKGDLKLLLNRVFDFKKIKNQRWLLPAVLLIPVLLFLSYLVMLVVHYALPNLEIKLSTAAVFAVLFFIGAIGEEVGWAGFVTDPLQQRFGALMAALVIGSVWAVWHIIPFMS